MNDNELNNQSSSPKETYRATSNLNIDIENPQINVHNVVGVNIKDVDTSNSINDRFSDQDIQMNDESYASFGTVSNYENHSMGHLNSSFSNSQDPIMTSSNESFSSYESQEGSHFDSSFNGSSNTSEQGSYYDETSFQGNYGQMPYENSFSEQVGVHNVSMNTSGTSENQFLPNMSSEKPLDNEYVATASTSKPMYEPTLEEKKQKDGGFAASKELKITIFIVFILFLFLLLMPYIYDFFERLSLVLTG